LKYSIEYISRRQRGTYTSFSTNPCIVIQCLLVDKLYKGQLAELPTISDSFYTTNTNDHIEVEVGGGGEPQKWWVFPHVEVDTAEKTAPRKADQ